MRAAPAGSGATALATADLIAAFGAAFAPTLPPAAAAPLPALAAALNGTVAAGCFTAFLLPASALARLLVGRFAPRVSPFFLPASGPAAPLSVTTAAAAKGTALLAPSPWYSPAPNCASAGASRSTPTLLVEDTIEAGRVFNWRYIS